MNYNLSIGKYKYFYTQIFSLSYKGSLIVFLSLQMFKEKAASIGEKLLPAFKTPTGIPQSMVNIKT